MNTSDKIIIIGAGLCGSLLSLRLAQRGYKIEVYESRPDLRTTDISSSGRSINLALSNRGFKALRLVGVEQKVRAICIPMYGRLMHDINGNTFNSDYSGRKNEYINSISRGDLNRLLLTEMKKHKNISIYFNKRCTGIDIENTVVNFQCNNTKKKISIDGDVIFGTDGAGSIIRQRYYLEHKFLFNYCQKFLTYGYKELEIPADKLGNHQISKRHLHIWPRGNYMLIALPNVDGSFTVTLFLSYNEGEYNFGNLISEEKITAFFKTQFPDALALIPNIKDEFLNNPTGPLGTIKCSPWHYKNKTILMGDAAHAIVPFYGQGMNASFEDVTIFDSVLEDHQSDWESIFKYYEHIRKKDTDAIADLAIDNFYEMRDHVSNPLFKEKRKLEMTLEKTFPNLYFSKYSMVTFQQEVPYETAMKKGRAQDKAILNLIKNNQVYPSENLSKKELKHILNLIEKQTKTILEENPILY